MKPASVLPKTWNPPAPTYVASRLAAFGRVDLRNVALLIAGLATLLVLIPPVRSYPMSDDWAYAQSVTRLLDFTYRPHDWTQPTSIGHLAWGALFAFLFGNNFNVITLVTILMSASCLVLFYLLLRHLSIASPYALFATALLGLNPMYVYLTYSFMTDITFIAYTLAACLFFVRAIQGRGDGWLWLGGAATALAYLTRQHGIVLVPAILAFLWWSRQLTFKKVIASSAIPLATVATYMIWERTQPPQLVSQMVSTVVQSILSDPGNFAVDHMQRFIWVTLLPGLLLLPFFRMPRHPLLAAPLIAFFIFFEFRSQFLYGSLFPESGNLLDHTGLVMYIYDRPVLWSEQVWAILGIIGGFSMAIFLTNVLLALWMWLRTRPWRDRQGNADPMIFVYLSGALLAVITFASPFIFDRYVLPILPFMMLFPLRRLSAPSQANEDRPGKMSVAPWLVLLPIALFSVLAIRDYKAEATARWQTAENLVSSGVKREQIDAGFEWLGWNLFQEGVDYIRSTHDYTYVSFPPRAVTSSDYLVTEIQRKNYSQLEQVPYDSWLGGGQTRYILVLKRNQAVP